MQSKLGIRVNRSPISPFLSVIAAFFVAPIYNILDVFFSVSVEPIVVAMLCTTPGTPGWMSPPAFGSPCKPSKSSSIAGETGDDTVFFFSKVLHLKPCNDFELACLFVDHAHEPCRLTTRLVPVAEVNRHAVVEP